MWCDIAWGAEKTIIEADTCNMHLSKFIPFKREANVFVKEA